MEHIDLGTTGEKKKKSYGDWCEMVTDAKTLELIKLLGPGTRPNHIQKVCFKDKKAVTTRRNVIVSGPTNSGKSLIGYIMLFQSIKRGDRALLIEPFRAIAQEKYEELTRVKKEISNLLGKPFDVVISTGDYRLNEETMQSLPPDGGELVIATPERVESIMRNPDYDKWISSFGAVCVDEAHLISDHKRGSVIEFVITSFCTLKSPPRIVLLSATLGKTEKAQEWLSPCDLAHSTERWPQLSRTLIKLSAEDNSESTITDLAKEVLDIEGASLLIFTYQTRSTPKLAAILNKELGDLCGDEGALFFHSQMSSTNREQVRQAYLEGRSRCLVSTTALGAGVNLPTTHLLIRDLTFQGFGKLSLDKILQMSGRAGRGDREGHAYLLHKPNDDWDAGELSKAVKENHLPALTSALIGHEQDNNTAKIVLSILARQPKDEVIHIDSIKEFVAKTLAGSEVAPQCDSAVWWLSDPSRVLIAEKDEKQYCATALGLATARTSLPLSFGSGAGNLFRDLFGLGIKQVMPLIKPWGCLDHLILTELMAEKKYSLRRFSNSLVKQVDDWMDASSDKSVLYREFIRGEEGFSKADQLMGSLSVSTSGKKSKDWERQQAYNAVFRAIILWERSKGVQVDSLERVWDIQNVDGIEEQWRDRRIWLLAGLGEILDIKCFYFHLKESCEATEDEIKNVKDLLKKLQRAAWELIDYLNLCSPLGPLFVQMKQSGSGKGVGRKTVKKLEGMGHDLIAIAKMKPDEFKRIGISGTIAQKLQQYARKRVS
ncbi:DEAD/DEAH box helicase [Verrucomicrobia bacterium]|nr:DEAD/DEAH box helicase [Verrucomicrobiota bacterium]